jgi:hypothetical protein
MSTDTQASAIALASLPALGADLDGGIFAGIITRKDGQHCAVVLLPARGQDLTWKKAGAWAKDQGGELPTRPLAALIFANVQDRPQEGWHWTSEEYGASYAWSCGFGDGLQSYDRKSFEGSAVAVRMIPINA